VFLSRWRGWSFHPVLSIFADFIDPFCYVGFVNLRRAAEAARVPLAWHGFEFNPDTPTQGMPLETAANSDLRPGMWASVQGYASKSGLSLKEPHFVPKTLLPHTLVLQASRHVKIPLIDCLFEAYFSSQKNIGDPEILINLTRPFGISEAEIQRAQGNARGAKELERNRSLAIRHHFPGMPGFAYRGKTYFGALSTESWPPILKSK
jgi:predicted DsbA family dithiol-disulfide isomerase